MIDKSVIPALTETETVPEHTSSKVPLETHPTVNSGSHLNACIPDVFINVILKVHNLSYRSVKRSYVAYLMNDSPMHYPKLFLK